MHSVIKSMRKPFGRYAILRCISLPNIKAICYGEISSRYFGACNDNQKHLAVQPQYGTEGKDYGIISQAYVAFQLFAEEDRYAKRTLAVQRYIGRSKNGVS